MLTATRTVVHVLEILLQIGDVNCFALLEVGGAFHGCECERVLVGTASSGSTACIVCYTRSTSQGARVAVPIGITIIGEFDVGDGRARLREGEARKEQRR